MTTPKKMTARWVEAVPPPASGTAIYRDTVARGLELQVSTRGKKTWVLPYSTRRDGKRLFPQLLLGYAPAVSLADARDRVDTVRRALATGADPVAALTAALAAQGQTLPRVAPSARPPETPRQGVVVAPDVRTLLGVGPDDVILPNSFGALAAHYLVHRVLARDGQGRPHLRKWKDEAAMLRSYLLPQWRDLDVTTITRRLIHDLTDAIAERGSESPWVLAQREKATAQGKPPRPPRPAPRMAARIASLVTRVFSFALDRSWVTQHPALRLGGGTRDDAQATKVSLVRDEILTLWTACEEDDDPICAAAMLLTLFTGMRISCVLQAEWSEFELDDPADAWWTVPGDREGNKKTLPHRVALGPYSVQLLEELRAANYHTQFLFPHRGIGGWRKPGFFEALVDVLAKAPGPLPPSQIAQALQQRLGVTLPVRRADLATRIGCELSRRSKQDDPYVRRDPEGWVLTATPLKSVFGDGPLTRNTPSWQAFTARVCPRFDRQITLPDGSQATQRFTPHKLRHTLTTQMGRLKVPHEYKQQVLGHTPQDVTSKEYDEYEYDDEKRVAMTLWHRQLRAWKEGGAPEVLRFPVLQMGA